MDWLHIDTTPSKLVTTKSPNGLITPLSANDCRRGSDIPALPWSIFDHATNSRGPDKQEPITPPSCNGSFRTEFSVANSGMSWEEVTRDSLSGSPYEYLDYVHPKTPQRSLFVEEQILPQQDRDWLWIPGDVLASEARLSQPLQHGIMTTSETLPDTFQSNIPTTVSDIGLNFQETDILPCTTGLSSFDSPQNMPQPYPYPHMTASLPSNAKCGFYDNWRDVSIVTDVAVMHNTARTVSPGDMIPTWEGQYNINSDDFEDAADLLRSTPTSDSHIYDTALSALAESDMFEEDHSDNMKHSALVTRTGAKKVIRKPRKGSNANTRRTRTKKYFGYETKLNGREVDIYIEPDIPKDSDGRFFAYDREKKEYKCQKCDSVFGRSEHLYRHNFTHLKITPFRCAYCNREFNRKDNCRVHLRTHLNNSKLTKNHRCSFRKMYAAIRDRYTPAEAKQDIDKLEDWRRKKGLSLD